MMKASVTCSAPGKILLAGGYLVLDPDYTGLVLSLSARIYTTVSEDPESRSITVKSPQFKGATWEFTTSDHDHVRPVSTQDNPFVREALETLLVYFHRRSIGLSITIHADNQYYSLPPSPDRFAVSDKSIAETPKTGLGSSAALITSLCSALYILLRDDERETALSETDIRTIHNLAQVAHCRAQGKVGSGFDVASAVYGSCIYRRFSAEIIRGLPAHLDRAALRAVVEDKWFMEAERVQLRPGLMLLMGDVAQGSSTPGMVQKVKSSSAAMDVWPSLGIANDLLAEYLTKREPYDAVEQGRIREVMYSVRGLLKQMGVEAEVEIEPDSQTAVLDETAEIDGVVACGVPGAGGYDAIFAIVSSNGSAATKVREFWHERGIKALDLGDDGMGIQVEHGFEYRH